MGQFESRIQRVGDDVRAGILDINSGANGTVRDVINGNNIRKFLRSPRGFALIFWALNRIDTNQQLYYVSETEWRMDRPLRPDPLDFLLDCHTHYIQAELPGRTGTHTDRQYHAGALTNWWFFPEAYTFIFAADGITVTPRGAAPGLHSWDQFRELMGQLATQLNTTRLGFFISPAPYGTQPLNGVSDTASFDDMKSKCNAFNLLRLGRCYPIGVIKNGAGARRFPENAVLNEARLWKIYPSRLWDEKEQNWIANDLRSSLASLPGRLNNRDWHTVLIHWWDGGLPSANNIGAIAGAYSDRICFVLYHACHPNEGALSALLDRTNVFAEIGGTFAYQILGSDGLDRGDPMTPIPGRPTGEAAARQTIALLRGHVDAAGIGRNDHKILWGTDAIWHGSAAWQIEAFRRLRLAVDPGIPEQDQKRRDWAFKSKVLQENGAAAFSIYDRML